MKKLYRKSSVHPSPSTTTHPISFLPATILSLAATLSAADQEVLSYLLSCSSTTTITTKSHRRKTPNNNHHPPEFTCYCFNCYTSYWARWDSSSNRHLIHEIIDAVENEGLLLPPEKNNKQGMSKKEKRKNNITKNRKGNDVNGFDESVRVDSELGRPQMAEQSGGKLSNGDEETGENGSVRRFVGFIGEKIWGSVWG